MRWARHPLGCFLAAAALLSACGDSSQNASADTAPATVASSVAPATTVAPTTAVPATTVASTTTVAPTTTLPPTTTTVPETTVPETTLPSTTAPPAAAPEALPVPAVVPVDGAGPAPKSFSGLGRIEIPKIGVSVSMYEGIALSVLDRGPGHWPGTAMPGHAGNVVVAGHRVSHSKPFRNIDRLSPGDQVIFTTSEGRFTYRVTSTEYVTPDAIRIVDQTASATATLFACHPPGSTRQRIVIHLALVG